MAALVLVVGHSNVTQAQTGLYAGPNPFYRFDGIDITAWNFTNNEPTWCETWWGCYYTGYAFVDVGGSDGFYTWGENYDSPWVDAYGWDGTPGQTMQPATYWAHGYVHWTIWYCVLGCTEDYQYDDGGWQYTTVNPDPCFPFPEGESTALIQWGAQSIPGAFNLAGYWMSLQNPEPLSFSMAGRRIREVNAAWANPAYDTCWFDGSPFTQRYLLSGADGNPSSWSVQSGDQWGNDWLGWSDNAIFHYRYAYYRAPCGTLVPQIMTIQCGAADVVYSWTDLRLGFDWTSVWAERQGVFGQHTY